jgi:hypothetical protein
MVNQIEKLRASIAAELAGKAYAETESETAFSPGRHFRMLATTHGNKDGNRELVRVQLFTEPAAEKLFDFFTDDGRFFYGWVQKESTEYFICAEELCGGQTVIDLTNRKMAGYSPGDDGFIWTDFQLSPGGDKLATIGCYWACPTVIKLYDFSDPLSLPLKEIKEFNIESAGETIIGWMDNDTISIREMTDEYQNMLYPDRTEAPYVRHLNINEG